MTLPRDLRTAVRALSRKPGVTALALVSLALATGFSSAAFSVLDAWSLRELPVRNPAELAWVYVNTREHRPDVLTPTEYQALASRNHVFSDLMAQARETFRVRLADRDDFPIIENVTDNYFDGLGVRARLGDVFHRGAGQDQTVVLSDRYWHQAFGGDVSAIGRSLEVRGAPLRVVGVLPAGFNGASRGIAVDLFVLPQTFFGVLHAADPTNVRYREYELVGRLRPGVTHEQARADLDPILRQLEKDGLTAGPDRTPALEDFTEKGLRAKLESNGVFLAAMVLLIAIAAANLANLRLVDNEGRRRETGIRLALGAGRWSLAGQHLAEAGLLAAAGTGAGLLLASWLIRLASSLLYAGKSYLDYHIAIDGRTFAFSAVALIVVTAAAALIPLGDAWKRSVGPSLSGVRVTGASRWLTVLVVAQMALVTAATCSAGLLWRSLRNIDAIRPAMDPDARVLMMRGTWPGPTDAAVRAAELAGHMAGVPGVEQVAWARRAMLSGSGGGATVAVEMQNQPKYSFRYNQVSPGYFAAVGARVLNGRAFTESDGPAGTPVAMVNAAFVRRFLGSEPPLGRWIRVDGKDRQVVGVVEDGPGIHLLETIEPYLYFPFAQMPVSAPTFFVETRANPGRLAAPLRAMVRTSDPTFRIGEVFTLEEHMRGARSSQILAAEVTGGLAGVGLLLAAAGLFGVSLFAVARRTREFGVRVAMGATPEQLTAAVLRQSALRVAVAIPIGWVLALTARHALQKVLYGVAPDDPGTFVVASVVVALVGCGAALHPAWRAGRTDPVTALRHD